MYRVGHCCPILACCRMTTTLLDILREMFKHKKFICLCPDAAWNSESRALFPLFEELAKHFSDTEDVVVARIDVTTNDVNIRMLDRYPTIKLFPAVYAERVRNIHLLVKENASVFNIKFHCKLNCVPS